MNGSLISLNELLIGDKLFEIPVYQRSYAWEEENLKDFWEDLYYLDTSKQHYFGTVLLKDSGKTTQTGFRTFKKFDVIDGQQRLTTALILLREITLQIKAVNDDESYQKDVADLEETYLKHGVHYKLNPLGEDGEFFHNFVIDNNEHLKHETQTRSQGHLVAAKSFFRDRLDKQKKEEPSKFEDFLRGLKYKIDGLQLMQYIVNSDADAIRIFETANDRGRPLNNLEKTKSFLMHTSYLGTNENDGAVESKLKELNQRFFQIYRYSEDVSENEHIKQFGPDDIQRYHFINYISENSSDYMDELKNCIRNMLRENADECVEYALAYAEDLEQTFHAVKNIAASHEKEDELGKLLGKIFMIGRLANIFPLLIASWLRFGEQIARMAKILTLFEAFTFRVYAVGRYRSDTAIGRLNGMAHKVHKNRLDYDALIDELKKINNDYRDDHRFADDLRSKYFFHRWGHDIKYLLSEYEIYLRDESREPLTLPQKEVLSSEYQVEHIWAQNPSDEPEYDDDTRLLHEQNVHRLGNLTITSKSWNSSMGNKPFEEKKLKYVDSSLRVQRELVGWDEWNNATICEREKAIVEFALQRWSV